MTGNSLLDGNGNANNKKYAENATLNIPLRKIE